MAIISPSRKTRKSNQRLGAALPLGFNKPDDVTGWVFELREGDHPGYFRHILNDLCARGGNLLEIAGRIVDYCGAGYARRVDVS